MASIKLRDVVVEFPVYGGTSRSLKTTFVRAATGGTLARDAGDRVVVRALDNITLELREGDRLGLMGHNGSGKTTLLRVIAGAYEPASGTVAVQGAISAMLSLWLGMDMEATGYENIFMRAAIMGMKRRHIARLVDEICDFADLGDYVHMPLRTYSTGMAMRLAFAISTSGNADIILMDEWLSVGDADFWQKANQRLNQLIGGAKIFVLASHDLNLIRDRCNRVARLEHGRLVSVDEIRAATDPKGQPISAA